MRSLCRSVGIYVLAVGAAIAFAGAPDASAQRKKKKMTYAQAFELCKKDVLANTPGETASSTARYVRGMGCMREYGFTLKRSTWRKAGL